MRSFTSVIVTVAFCSTLALANCDCPSDFSFDQVNDQCFCCPGMIQMSETNGVISSDSFCCVQSGANNSGSAMSSMFSIDFGGSSTTTAPMASATSAVAKRAITIDGMTCSTTIPLTASNYASLALAASALTQGTQAQNTNTATATASAASQATSNAAVVSRFGMQYMGQALLGIGAAFAWL